MASVSRGTAHDLGELNERRVNDRRAALRRVPDDVVEWHDSVATSSVVIGDPVSLDVSVLERGTPIEIKSAVAVEPCGRSGRWYIKRPAHERLLEAGGVYVLIIYERSGDQDILEEVVASAELVDEHMEGSWYDVDGPGRSACQVGKLTWSTLIDRERVVGEGGGPMMRQTQLYKHAEGTTSAISQATPTARRLRTGAPVPGGASHTPERVFSRSHRVKIKIAPSESYCSLQRGNLLAYVAG